MSVDVANDDVANDRIQVLQQRVRDLEVLHTQIVAYAEDLNRTYQELRLRLHQMTDLSGVVTRLSRARTVEACARTSVEGLGVLFANVTGCVFLEARGKELKLVAEKAHGPSPAGVPAYAEAAAAALATTQPIRRRHPAVGGTLHLIGLAMQTRGKPSGAVVVGRLDREFDVDDAHLIELLAQSAAVAMANARLYQETRRLAITDPTTGLFNFRHFRGLLPQEIQKARRFGYPIAVIMADVDFFKRFNDTYGHLNGNLALQAVARAFVRSLRTTDTVARYGGEEFAAILPGCDQAALARVAEKIRASVAHARIRVPPETGTVGVTISVGGAWQAAGEADAAALLAAADAALYVAKASGRDRAHIHP